jgi:HSP20 family protein
MSGRDPFEDIERLVDMLGGDLEGGGDHLPVDVADTGDAFVVVADLPGFDQESLEVQLTDETTLYIAAERDEEAVAEADRFVTRERHRHTVSRQVGLPAPVDESETSAAFEDGVLRVTLPKRTAPDDDGTDIPVN